MEDNKQFNEENATQESFENQANESSTIENTENLTPELSVEEQLAEQKDQYIRLFAEFENYKKRTLKEKI